MKRTPSDDVLRAPGLTIRRPGRFVEINSRRTPEQQEQLLAAVGDPEIGARFYETVVL